MYESMYPNQSNTITTEFYRALKEMKDPRAVKVIRQNGTHVYETYHLVEKYTDYTKG